MERNTPTSEPVRKRASSGSRRVKALAATVKPPTGRAPDRPIGKRIAVQPMPPSFVKPLMHVVRFIFLALSIFHGAAHAAIYQCQEPDGNTVFQDTPCPHDDRTLKKTTNRTAPPPLGDEYKSKLIAAFASMLGERVDKSNPKWQQAAEAFLVADAGKAYAFSRIHAVPLEFCFPREPLLAAMDNYNKRAQKFIALGAYYYTHGFDLQLGEKRMRSTGPELQQDLERKISEIRSDYAALGDTARQRKCDRAVDTLRQLSILYGE